MTDLCRLVYTSRNLMGGEGNERERTVASIVDASRRNNGRAGVTGALLFSAGRFGQVLEGPRAAVEATFERIQRDPRHGDISILQCDAVAERVFPGWSMAFVGRSERESAVWDGLARSTGFDIGRFEGDRFCAALLAVVRAEEGADAASPTRRTPPLDVDRLRSALDAERPDLRAAPADESRTAQSSPLPASVPRQIVASAVPVSPPPAGRVDIGERVLRAALDAERERTTALRQELDEAYIALARSEGETEALGRHRDIWADRSSQLRTTLKEVREALGAVEAERDELRARLTAHDGDMETLRTHRDIWAERARALAAALCRDPAVEHQDPAQAGPIRPVADRERPSPVRVVR